MENSFLRHINSIVDVPQDQQEKFCKLVSDKHIKKGDYFLREGELSKTIAFVKKGLFRYYYIDYEGNEFTKDFFAKNTILISYSSMLEQRGSYFFIQALEDSELEEIDYFKAQKLMAEHPCWNAFLVVHLQGVLGKKVERERELLMFDAEDRYRKFLEQYPGIDTRVKQHMIASYLGIMPQSLSRIRKNMKR